MRFADIPGHEEAKNLLRRLADTDHIPHALLLEGPPGVGKLALARAFVQYVNCREHTPDGDSCGVCPVCRQMEAFNQIDTLYSFPVVKESPARQPVSDDYLNQWKEFLRKDSYASYDGWCATFASGSKTANIRPTYYVSESNDLIHKLNFQSHALRYKSVVMWLPEKLGDEAANKLLKMIEEPFPNTLIVMVSNAPEEILPTIYSRLQRVTLKRLPDDVVAAALMAHGASPQQARQAARQGAGNMTAARQALGMTDETAHLFDLFKQLMRLAYSRDVAALKNWAVAMKDMGRERQIKFYTYAQNLVRENFMLNFSVPELNLLGAEEEAFSRNFARFITTRNVEGIIAEMNSAITDIAGNADATLVNFDLAIKMIMLIKQ